MSYLETSKHGEISPRGFGRVFVTEKAGLGPVASAISAYAKALIRLDWVELCFEGHFAGLSQANQRRQTPMTTRLALNSPLNLTAVRFRL